jgi:glycosyltransferase involved in cell wall biosynthesis
MVFPFGLERMPAPPARKEPWLFFSNRTLEPLYRPQRVLEVFAALAAREPEARLVVANDGSLRDSLQRWVQERGLGERVQFTGRLDAAAQSRCYAQAQWYLSLPQSDSVAVSVLEAMAHACIPLLSDLPANRELVDSGRNGLIVADDAVPSAEALQTLRWRAQAVGHDNRQWVQQHGLFAPAVQRLLVRLQELSSPP